jgi:PAS domain S-box-containing protein
MGTAFNPAQDESIAAARTGLWQYVSVSLETREDHSTVNPSRRLTRHLVIIAVAFAAYFVAGKLGQATTNIRSSNLGPVWPAYGVALAMFLIYGRSVWIGILGAAFLVAYSSPVPAITAAGQAAGATLATFIGSVVLRHVAGFETSISRLRDALNLIVVGALSACISASIGLFVLYAGGVQAYSGLGSAWLIYWLGDSTGVLLITPLVLTAPQLLAVRSSRIAELSALLLLVTLTCLAVFGDSLLLPVKLHVLAFVVLPFVVWAAIRFGVSGVTLATLLIATIATVETALGSGPFAQHTAFTNAVLLDVFFAVLSVSGMSLAAVIAERQIAERERERLVREQAAMEEKQRADEALRESEDKLRLILDSTAEAIYGIDLEGRCTFCNPACVRMLGYRDAADLLGRNMHELSHHRRADGTALPQAESRLRRASQTGDGVHADDEVFWRADGTSFPVEYWSYPQRRGQKVVGAVVAFIDITQRKRAELQTAELREELAHLGRVTVLDALAGSIAHEINQPLTAVMANAEAAIHLLAAHPLPVNDVRDALQEILSDNRRAGHVVQQLRTLLKRSTTEHEPIELNSAVADVVTLVRNNAAGRRIRIDVELEADLGPVLGSRTQVQQVVLNLVMNAFDAVQELEPALRRVTLKTTRRERAAAVTVCDRGAGIADDQLARIFEPFYTTKREGLGLGLAICRAIVGAHGGTIEGTRNGDKGMIFTATFPVWQQAERHLHNQAAGQRVQER